MVLVVADRVQETTSTTGTSDYTLLGAEPGFQSFGDVMSNADTTYYAITDDTDWEVGIGTYSTTGPTLARTTILSSSNGGTAVSWSAGTKKIFLSYAAEKSVYLDGSNNLVIDGTAVTATATELNYVDGVTSNIQAQLNTKASKLTAIATGALSDGSPVVINSDGTVSVVAQSVTPISAGSGAVYETSSVGWQSAAYDAASQKIVIAYRDANNSSYGTAVVGTVSGTSISFGTPVVFESSGTQSHVVVYDANAQKVVIDYMETNVGSNKAIVGTVSGTSISFGSAVTVLSGYQEFSSGAYDSVNQRVVFSYSRLSDSYGTAVVGTVSGTSVSFGTPVVFNSATTLAISSTYDTGAQRVVIAYRDVGNSGHGTAIVGTVSGTSISFGTEVVFESASTNSTTAAYDSASQKVVIAYQDAGNSSYGTAIVGTVSGTSISFGTAAVFESASSTPTAAVYASGKVVVFYVDGGNSNYGTMVEGTVSGTSISFDTPEVFNAASTSVIRSTYDAASQKAVVAYTDGGNSSYATAKVVTLSSTTTNLTAENFIGFSDGAYSNGATATIDVVGSASDAQSGLTAGQQYYVTAAGTLSLTPSAPAVFAGTAISASKILVGAALPETLSIGGTAITATAAELNFVDGVTSNIQTQLDSKGPKGGGSNAVFYENDQTVTDNYTIPAGKNAMSTGPVTVNAGVTVTVSAGARYVVI